DPRSRGAGTGDHEAADSGVGLGAQGPRGVDGERLAGGVWTAHMEHERPGIGKMERGEEAGGGVVAEPSGEGAPELVEVDEELEQRTSIRRIDRGAVEREGCPLPEGPVERQPADQRRAAFA